MNKYSQSLILSLTDLTEACLKLVISKYLKNQPDKEKYYDLKYRNLDFDSIYPNQLEIINDLILEIYDSSESEKFYFFDCPISVYEDNYDWRLKHFLKEFKDSEEIDFLNEELLKHTTKHKDIHTIEFYYDDLNINIDFNNLITDSAFENSFVEINDWTIIINYSNLIQDFDYFKSSKRKKIDFINSLISNVLNNEDKSGKLKLINKTSQIGFIFSQLANLGYIEAPKRAGEINYNAFAREIINSFNCDVKSGSLAKYLNPLDDKHQETERNFKSQNFNIPDTNSIS